MEKSYKNMAIVIKESRIRAGVTQTALAEVLGFGNSQFISNIERGLAALPACHFKKVAKILNISCEDLISAYVKDKTEHARKLISRS